MLNPWRELPSEPPFVLTEDAPALNDFNRRAREATRVHLKLLPEPFLGNPCAPVILLGLNPGFSSEDAACHKDSTFVTLSRENLEHRTSDHSFYLLNPRVRCPGRCWWERKLGPVLEVVPQHIVASRVFCVEYLGYHSKVFDRRLRLPSQEYGFSLVREALARGALVVLMRSRRLWFEAVPELETYPRLFELRSPQNPTISLVNCAGGFEEIVTLLKIRLVEGSG